MTGPMFTTGDGLRTLLVGLHREPRRWRNDPLVAALLRHCTDRYRSLARKYGQEPDDAARAAFEVLRAPATRWARDPWAVVTDGVLRDLQREQRANGLLCDAEQARHLLASGDHDATRFAAEELRRLEADPALQSAPDQDALAAERDDADETPEAWRRHAVVPPSDAFATAGVVLVECGWSEARAAQMLDAIRARLLVCESRRTAFEYLRRDTDAWCVLDLTQRQWTRVLAVILGRPAEHLDLTSEGRGLLWRLINGQTLDEVLADPHVTRPLITASAISAPVAVSHA